MKRLYLNPVHGRQCIHIELTSHDISDILEAEMNDVQLPATRALTEILEEARDIFGRASATGQKGYTPAVAPGGDQLREALRSALDRFIDPDDDTMPYCNRVDGGYTWTPADGVIDRLVRAVHRPIGVVAAAEAGVEPDCAVCGPNAWPCATVSTVYEEQP